MRNQHLEHLLLRNFSCSAHHIWSLGYFLSNLKHTTTQSFWEPQLKHGPKPNQLPHFKKFQSSWQKSFVKLVHTSLLQLIWYKCFLYHLTTCTNLSVKTFLVHYALLCHKSQDLNLSIALLVWAHYKSSDKGLESETERPHACFVDLINTSRNINITWDMQTRKSQHHTNTITDNIYTWPTFQVGTLSILSSSLICESSLKSPLCWTN